MTAKGIINQLVSTLQDSALLSDVNNNYIFKGKRAEINNFPSIEVIAKKNTRANDDINTKEDFRLQVMLFCSIKGMNIDDHNEEMFDLENNIKLTIDADPTLNGTAILAECVDTEYEDIEWPTCGMVIELSIYYRQTKGTRT